MNHAPSKCLKGMSNAYLFIALIVVLSAVTCNVYGHIKIGRELQHSSRNIRRLKISLKVQKFALLLLTVTKSPRNLFRGKVFEMQFLTCIIT